VDRAHWRTYFHTGWIGAVIGSPELARMMFARSGQGTEWLQRFDEFVPIPRLSEHGRFFLSALLVVVTFLIVRRYYRQLLYLWCLCAAGFIMIHEQVFTGLQMENYHWAYLFGPCMILLLVLLTVEWLERMGAHVRRAREVVILVLLLNAAAGLYLRGLEAVRTKDSQRYSRGYVAYEEQHAKYRPLAAGSIAAGTDDYVQYAMIVDHVSPLGAAYPVMLSPSVTDSELDYRYALDSYLSGESREAFESEQRDLLEHLQYGVELRDLTRRQVRLGSRVRWFDQIAANPVAEIEKNQVRYVAVPAGATRPAPEAAWTLLQKGPAWDVWVRGQSGSNGS
jgi:hypothetical protein